MQHVHDRSEELADRLGISMAVWDEVFGRGWVRSATEPWHDFDADPSGGLGMEVVPWHLRGASPRMEPQLMLRVFEHGVFVAQPRAIVAGIAGELGSIDYQPGQAEYVTAHELEEQAPEVVKWMLATRRRQFRWCARCWQQRAPEWMDGDVCLDCAGADGPELLIVHGR